MKSATHRGIRAATLTLSGILFTAMSAPALASPAADVDSGGRIVLVSRSTPQSTLLQPHSKYQNFSAAADDALICPIRGLELHNRTWSCAVGYSKIAVLNTKGQIIGTVEAQDTTIRQLNTKGRTWTESVRFDNVITTGVGTGFMLRYLPSCTVGCASTNTFPQLRTLSTGTVITGTVEYRYTDNTVRNIRNNYVLQFYHPEYTLGGGPFSWTSTTYRCDNSVGSTPGCVHPDSTPTLVYDSRLKPKVEPVARHVLEAQRNLPSHWGIPLFGKPLTRATDPALIDANRRVACGSIPDISCDEFPFAATHQGASVTPANDRSVAIVPLSANNSQGGINSAFIQNSRVLEKDPFNVCAILSDGQTSWCLQ